MRYNITEGKKDSANYMSMAEKLCRIYTLLAKSKTYLETKKENPGKPDIESEIEELMGYAWKLESALIQGKYTKHGITGRLKPLNI
jgi:hypothetical protein